MGFYGNHFSFRGIPCEEFGLAVYDIDGTSQGESGMIASTGEVLEDFIPTKSRSFFYGVRQNKPLVFTMIFGVDPELNKQMEFPTMEDFLDRWEIAKIANWLTGHRDTRGWLEIEQPDMETVRFFCTITDLKIITHAWYPWAFSCTVSCDSAYGYMYPKEYKYTSAGTTEVILNSKSLVNELYYPKMTIIPQSVNLISIINKTDGNREFLLKDLPISIGTVIDIDNDRGIMKTSDRQNIYGCFNFNFFRLCQGKNELMLKGDFDIRIVCEFPVNVGG